jgi:solute carrier family 7 (L-type amino acid transporter), member 9/15
VLICLVIAGSLLGNSFVASRMAVAAANRGWFPAFLGRKGGFRSASSNHMNAGQVADTNAESPADNVPKPQTPSDAPLNALLLSSVFATLYILLGNFRSLLTFNGLAEYTFFFLTVLSAIVLRFREPALNRPYKPLIVVPFVFAVVSGFVVVRGAVFAPVLGGVLLALWGVGGLWYFVLARRRRRTAGEMTR